MVARHAFGIDDTADYPLFTPDLIELMRELIPADRHGEVATVVTVTAHKP